MVRRGFARDGAEFGRGLGFFDAIFAFAITLLVVNLDPPPAEAWGSLSTLLGDGFGDKLLGFAISFVVIAVFWRANTEALGRFTALDGTVITANLCVMGFVVLIPFTTQGISEFSDYPLAVALYAANVALAILAQMVTEELARRRGLVEHELGPAAVRAEQIDAAVKIAVFLMSIPVAYLVSPAWGMKVWLLLAIVAPLTGRWVDKVAKREQGPASAPPQT